MKKLNSELFKNHLKACLSYLIIVSIILTGVTFSKHITQTGGVDKSRSASIEELMISESGDFVSENTMIIIPGQPLNYNAEVHFGGCEASTYLFVEMNLSDKWSKDTTGKVFTAGRLGSNDMSFTIDDTWNYLKSEGNKHIYYIEVSPNTPVTKDMLKDSCINVSSSIKENTISNMHGISIDFRAVVVQSNEFSSPSEAWNSINK